MKNIINFSGGRQVAAFFLILATVFQPFAFVLGQAVPAQAEEGARSEGANTPQVADELSPSTNAKPTPKQDKEKESKKDKTGDGEEPPGDITILSASSPGTLGGDPHKEDEKLPLTKRLRVQPGESTGALQYSYLLTIPPGRNGLHPNLELAYSSEGGDDLSPFSYGWSVPVPYIERINREGVNTLYTKDYFYSSLDGELASTTGDYFGPKVENGNFRRYEFATSSTGWIVTDKQGSIYTFGTATSTRLHDPDNEYKVSRWMLEEVRDTNDNYISYSYTKDSGQIYPDTITYTGNGVTDGDFEIAFLREARSDIATSTAYGFPIVSKQRIYEIQAKIDGSWVRKYALAYTTGSNGIRSLLDIITETGKDESGATVTLPATNFNYQASQKTWTEETNYDPCIFIDSSNENTGCVLVDVNGDGFDDLVTSKVDITLSVSVSLNDGDGTGWSGSYATSGIPAIVDAGGNDQGIRFADVNGDGFVDILGNSSVSLNNADGTGWTQDANWSNGIGDFVQPDGDDLGQRVADVNGDGLPDIIQNSSVYLNNGNGTGWTNDPNWDLPVSFVDGNQEDRGVRLVDVNGDGLVDILHSTAHHESANAVYINQVTNSIMGWVHYPNWGIPETFLESTGEQYGVRFADVNGDGLVDLLRSDAQDAGANKVYINDGDGTGWTYDSDWSIPVQFADGQGGDTGGRIADINGDGLADIVRGDGHIPSTQLIYINQGKKADLLTKITHSEGGRTVISYKPAQHYRSGSTLFNPHLPFVTYTVEKIEHHDGLSATTSTMTYEYRGGDFYFGFERDRKFAGFGTTTVSNAAGFVTKTYFHQGNDSDSGKGENSDDISKLGKPYRVEVYDGSSNVYAKTINRWENSDLGQKRDFVKRTRTVDFSYDGDSDHADKAEEYTYSNTNGNLTQRVEWGKVTGSDNGTFTDTGTDKFTTDISYAASTTPYIIGLPSQETVNNQSSAKVKEARYYYDSKTLGNVDKGNETKREFWKTGSTYIDTEKTFNSYGLVTQEKDPRDKITTYTYETNNLYVATSTSPVSHVTGYAYDYSIGKPKRITNPNSHVFEMVYDALDRVKEEKQPDLTTPSTRVTKSTITYTDSQPRSLLETHNLDGLTSFQVYKYFDGLGRIIQERKEAEDVSTYAVRDFVYNNKGLLEKESLPYFSTGTSRTTATTSSAMLTTYTQDPLERVNTIVNAAGTTSYTYDDWKTTITDPESNIRDLTRDAYGNLTQVDEHNGASTYTTSYEYNYLRNLTKITDAASNIRNFTYDGLSRRTAAEDLHAAADGTFGSWSYTYDDAGNVTSYTNPDSKTVDYTYDDINRLLTENYTGATGTEVTFAYDICTFGKGLLCGATTTVASTHYAYNALGGTASETRTISSADYTTSYEYDRQGNQIKVTYPDNAEATYAYNTAGLLESVSRKESGGSTISVITDFDYSPTEQVTYQRANNGAETTRTYDKTKLYRLKHLQTTFPGGMGGAGLNEDGGYPLVPISEFSLAAATTTTTDISPEESTSTNSLQAEEIEAVEATNDTLVSEDVTAEPMSVEEPAQATTTSSLNLEQSISTESPAAEISVKKNEKDPELATDGLIKDAEEARAWRKYFKDRVEYLKSTPKVPKGSLAPAEYAQEKFEKYLLKKGYISKPGADISPAKITWVKMKSWFNRLIAFFLPNSAYAYLFGSEDFETCSSLPCSFTTNYSWGSVTPSLDSTSKVAGTDSLKEVVTGEGGGAMKKAGFNRSEIWVQFKVWVPDPVTWGASGFFDLLILQDSSSVDTIWMNVEDYGGAARLTVAGDVLSYIDTGLNLTEGAVNTVEMRVKIGSSTGDIDIWLNNSTQGSPNYNGSGSLNTGTDNIDAVLAGLPYAPENGVSTSYYDNVIVDSAFIGSGSSNSAPTAPTSLQTEGQTNPTNITDGKPEFSAIYNDPDTSDLAPYYRIQVSTTSLGNWSHAFWDSGTSTMATTTQGNRSPDISYNGSALASSTTYYWRIRFSDDDRKTGAWSTATSTFSLAASAGGGGPSNPPRVSVVQDLAYTYDNVGNITRIVDVSDTDTEKTVDYAYDDLYRIKSATSTLATSTQSNYTRTYSYNSIGNFTSKSDVGSYAYGGSSGTNYANPHAATDIAGSSQSYSRSGNLLSSGSWKYRWDYKDRLAKATTTSAASAFGYDHNGDRVTLFENNATTTIANKFYSVQGATTTKHIYANGQLVATVESTGGGGGTPSTPAYVQSKDDSATGVVTLNSSVTTGNTIVVGLTTWNSSIPSNAITDNKGNTYTKVAEALNGVDRAAIFYAKNVTGGSSFTVTSSVGGSISAHEYSNLDTSAPLDQSSTNTGSSAAPQSGNITTTGANYLFFGVAWSMGHNDTWTANGPYSLREQEINNDTAERNASEDMVATTATTTKALFTTSASNDWAAVLATFKPAGGGGGGSGTTTIAYVHTDHLGGMNAATNDHKDLIQIADYYPFGSLRVNKTYTDFNEKRKFTGYEHDSSTGLNYAGARYQNGTQGRFTSQDPAHQLIGDGQFENRYHRKLELHLSNPQGLNSYSYAVNNPVKIIDDNGEIIPILAALAIAYSAVEFGLSAYDTYSTIRTLFDPNSSTGEKGAAIIGTGIGLVAPGGGYGVGAKNVTNIARIARNGNVIGKDINFTAKFGNSLGGKMNVIESFLAKEGVQATEHGLRRIAEREARGITSEKVVQTLKEGARYYDKQENNVSYFLNGIRVAVDRNNVVETVVTQSNISPDRFIPLK